MRLEDQLWQRLNWNMYASVDSKLIFSVAFTSLNEFNFDKCDKHLLFISSFIGLKFTHHKIHHFKLHNSLLWGISTELYKYCHSLIVGHFNHQTKSHTQIKTHCHSPSQPTPTPWALDKPNLLSVFTDLPIADISYCMIPFIWK